MENPSFVNDSEACREACVSLQKQQMLKEKRLPESPWHQLKTIFLVGTLVLLVIWVVVYASLSQVDLL